jgi:hypothetical protein
MSKESCPPVRIILTSFSRFFRDVTATIDAEEERLAFQTQRITRLEVEYQDKRILFPINALRDIGPISMNSWEFREEFTSRMSEPTLYLLSECPIELPNRKLARRIIQAVISKHRLRSISIEMPQSEHSSQCHTTEY